MTETLVREALADAQRQRERLLDQDRVANAEKALAVLQTKYDAFVEAVTSGALTKPEIETAKKELRKEMNDAFEKLRIDLKEDRLRWTGDMQSAQEETRKAIAEQHKRWINRAVLAAAVVMSILIGGIESGMKALQAAGIGWP